MFRFDIVTNGYILRPLRHFHPIHHHEAESPVVSERLPSTAHLRARVAAEARGAQVLGLDVEFNVAVLLRVLAAEVANPPEGAVTDHVLGDRLVQVVFVL